MDPTPESLLGSVSDKLDSSSMASDFIGAPVDEKRQYEEEIDALVRFFDEEEGSQVVLRYRKDPATGESDMQRKRIAMFLEGSRLPFSALVKDIFEKLSGENDQEQSKSGAVTMALVSRMILSLGERISFGITNPDTHVLEDDTVAGLWRWEVRDMKLLPRGSRDDIMYGRGQRKNIAKRIAALSATINALQPGKIEQAAFLQAREALAETDDESTIRAAKMTWLKKKSFVVSAQTHLSGGQKNPLGDQSNNLSQESGSKRPRCDPEEKERLRQEKLLKRQQVENEKEQKRKDREEADRKKQQQRQQDEADKELKRKEKEEGERKKQEKKQQDEAEKEQKREAERKKNLALRKQANFMNRFFVKKDQANCGQSQQAEAQATSPEVEPEKHEPGSQSMSAMETAAVVARMDIELNGSDSPNFEELQRSTVNNWVSLRNKVGNRKTQRWGFRRKPKVSVYRELRLQGPLGYSRGSGQDDSHVPKVGENSSPPSHLKRAREEFECCEDVDWKDNAAQFCPSSPLEEVKKPSTGRYRRLRHQRRKLFQFDKSHRPPYYGTFSKKSEYIKPRRPLRQDPALDYDVDSDEEWEEEDPGESLSDIEKDEDDEKVEIQEIEDDEDSADEFVVPDGYLSEDEGVAMEDSERGLGARGSSSHQSPTTPVQHNVMSPERLRRALDAATETAIRTNHPLVVSNLGQLPGHNEDNPSLLFPSNRAEALCLEALRIRVLIPNLLIGAF